MIKIALLSNINIDSLKFKLQKEYALFLPDGYNGWQQELINTSSNFYSFNPQICFLIIDGYEIFSTSVSTVIDDIFTSIEKALETLPQCRFFISDIDVCNVTINESRKISYQYTCESSWNKRLQACIDRYNNAYLFPLKDIIIQSGKDTAYSSKMWYLASNRFSIAGERLLINKMKEIIRPAILPPKKCLVLDMDNTLWGGVIGEDGPKGIQLDNHGEGARFYDFQKIIKKISEKGILLAVISKNNADDVDKVFPNPYMVLKKDDFIAMKANWDKKSENIEKIAKDLNLGLDSFVFVDDNPVEQEEMRQMQPNVIVADFPADTSRLAQFGIELYNKYFYSWDLSQEDLKKTQMYIENTKRDNDMASSSSIEKFLVDMNIKLSVKRVKSEHILRVSQMTQKTNQFNLTTKKYSEADISNMINDKNILILIGHIQDKYGDNGNSILVIIHIISSKEAEIDSFLMSCRIMNKHIEYAFLYEAEKILKEMGMNTIHAKYIRTIKNSPSESFFENAGYSAVSHNNSEKIYVLSLDDKIEKRGSFYVTIERDFIV